MSYRLICNQDPRALGIERPDGAWDLAVFDVHRLHCAPCRSFQTRLTDEVGTELTDIYETGRPAGGRHVLNASAELVIREAIDFLRDSRRAFRSEHVRRARELLESLLT